MNRFLYKILSYLLVLFYPGLAMAQPMSNKMELDSNYGNLVIIIEDVKAKKGMIWIGVYNHKDHFLIQEKATLVQGFKMHDHDSNSAIFYLDPIPYGNYAIAIFQDLNNNGYLDTNWIGLPNEPFAFNKPLASRLRFPRFNDFSFEFKEKNKMIKIKLSN